MNSTIKHIIFMIIIASALSSCTQNQNAEVTSNHNNPDASQLEVADHEEELGLHLTKKQIETIGLEFGDFTSLKVKDFVKATGTLGLPPNAYSSVTAKAEGIIKGNKKFVKATI